MQAARLLAFVLFIHTASVAQSSSAVRCLDAFESFSPWQQKTFKVVPEEALCTIPFRATQVQISIHGTLAVAVCGLDENQSPSNCTLKKDCGSNSKCVVRMPQSHSWSLNFEAAGKNARLRCAVSSVIDWPRALLCSLGIGLFVAAPWFAWEYLIRAGLCLLVGAKAASLLLRATFAGPTQWSTDFPVLILAAVSAFYVWSAGLSPEQQGVYMKRLLQFGALLIVGWTSGVLALILVPSLCYIGHRYPGHLVVQDVVPDTHGCANKICHEEYGRAAKAATAQELNKLRRILQQKPSLMAKLSKEARDKAEEFVRTGVDH